MIRPSLTKSIEALRALDPDSDLLAAAEYANSDHQGSGDDRDWGLCESCGVRWPCSAWADVEYAITEWLIKSSVGVIRRRSVVNGEKS